MGRGKSFKTDKEFSRIQELSHKNKELQREVARLKRELAKSKANWEDQLVTPEEEPKPRKKRTCYSCGKGELILKKYPKPEGYWYFRRCEICKYQTRSKPFTEDVED